MNQTEIPSAAYKYSCCTLQHSERYYLLQTQVIKQWAVAYVTWRSQHWWRMKRQIDHQITFKKKIRTVYGRRKKKIWIKTVVSLLFILRTWWRWGNLGRGGGLAPVSVSNSLRSQQYKAQYTVIHVVTTTASVRVETKFVFRWILLSLSSSSEPVKSGQWYS
jgi:hypothetical protein